MQIGVCQITHLDARGARPTRVLFCWVLTVEVLDIGESQRQSSIPCHATEELTMRHTPLAEAATQPLFKHLLTYNLFE